jgi:hypothetical protein
MNCPIWLDQIVTQMLQPDPRKRPHTARAISFAFDEIKNIDQTQKAAVVQLSGKFNPLNAGKDKTEANRLLGKKSAKKEPDVPFYQRVPFLMGCLVVIAAIIGYAMLPPSNEKLIAQGEALMRSERVGDWRAARGYFEKVIDRDDDPELVAKAERLYFETRRRTLVQQAEGGGVFLAYQSRNARKFGDAVQHQLEGREENAAHLFQELVEELSPDGDERHIWEESKNRLAIIDATKPDLPTDPGELLALLKIKDKLTTKSELKATSQLLAEIILEYAADDRYEQVVAESKKRLNVIEERLDNADFTESADSNSSQPSDTDASNSSVDDGANSDTAQSDDE